MTIVRMFPEHFQEQHAVGIGHTGGGPNLPIGCRQVASHDPSAGIGASPRAVGAENSFRPLCRRSRRGAVERVDETDHGLRIFGIAGIGIGVADDADMPPLRRLDECVRRTAIPIDVIPQRQRVETLGAGDGIVLASQHNLGFQPLIGELCVRRWLASGDDPHRRQAGVQVSTQGLFEGLQVFLRDGGFHLGKLRQVQVELLGQLKIAEVRFGRQEALLHQRLVVSGIEWVLAEGGVLGLDGVRRLQRQAGQNNRPTES